MGRGRFIVFDETMHQKLMEELNVDQALHRAVKDDLLTPKFTPLHNMDNGEELGFEVNPHWHHPEMGDVEPQYFANLAKSNGLIETIDQQMLSVVCQQMQPYGKLAATGLVCVNLSAANLNHNKSVQQLLNVVESFEVERHKLCFVFSEQGLLKLSSVNLAALKRVKQSGIGVSIKGFGSEVSSLGLLTKNSVDYVQVDASFTRSLLKNDKNKVILDTLLTLSHAFGFKVILDGVDNEALALFGQQKRVLIGLGKHFKPQSTIKLPQKPTLVLHKFA
jgi:EAL domain-containing protein (putative c-di-GMP-specific phosphodiesterase class I)